MFVELATAWAPIFGNNLEIAANAVLTGYRSTQISDFLEQFWRNAQNPSMFLGQPVNLADLKEAARGSALDPPTPPSPVTGSPPGWHHLVYAYMLENTRMMDIFRRVVFEYAHGERLPYASQETQRFLRVSEELFFTTPRVFSLRSVTSNLRPDDGGVRRNAYHRLLGMDLVHGTEDGKPYSYLKADVNNRDFSTLFEALLTEVWKGFSNRLNFVGENATDDEAIRTLLRRLQEMLQARRFGGTLSREEFDAVATLSWFHLTVSFNTRIVSDLSSQAAGEADRLKQIGERVGLPAHARSDAYFQLARPMSNILRAIENGAAQAAGPAGLYAGFFRNDMLTIITNWSIATGRDMKDAGQRQPLGRVLLSTVRTNGNGAQPPASRISPAVLTKR
jgi:hypothetical protein